MRYVYLLLSALLLIVLPSATLSQDSSIGMIVEGKKYLACGDYKKAEELFTNSLPELREIGDYILLWRATAYTGLQKYEAALKDIEEIKKNYPRSPLIKEARKMEIGLAKKINSSNVESLYESFVNEYAEDISVKFEYAQYLKEKGQVEKAKKLFKEVFITSSSLADRAESELSNEDITAKDLLKKAKALNSAYQFKKAEKYLKEALSLAKNSDKNEILHTIGYSLFMQKKYTEAAEVFKNCADKYWRARALLRAKDFSTFEKEVPSYLKSDDQRMADVFINYANIKRRAGAHKEASKILKTVIAKYPESREDALWSMAWNYYNSGEYEEAKNILQELYSSYGKLKYLYWIDKINETKGVVTTTYKNIPFKQGDIYSYLLYMKGKANLISQQNRLIREFTVTKRIEILLKAGFREEALREIKHLLKDNRDNEAIPFFSKILQELGDYPTSVRLISKVPNKWNFQELLYPQAYKDSVIKASRKLNLDPYLIFAIMREESRFDRMAISPAGAVGLMQLMPDTARREGRKIGINFNKDMELFEHEKNILIGSNYLRSLIEEFGSVVFAVAAYNAGEKAVWSWLNSNNYKGVDEFMEDIPFAETRNYVQRVMCSYFEYLRAEQKLDRENISKIIKIKGGSL